ncbi:hypothetical protein M408DRAFT_327029 [Serendipita vermifera MAFF 305830]|uniref:Tricalbin n=1 Tax=Serendipita vermifera MAFF 305830 TaxID=933852 RepID=A0A0C3BK65_SERVB|nr:hypothetical protein M408DRAFT_327029 [Serendipita vermifera MAFF 305830]
MASRTPPPPARPIPAAPVDNATQPVNEVSVKQAQNNVVSNIVAENDAQGVRTYNFSPDASPEEMKAVAGKAKAALGLPPVLNQTADKGAQGLSVASSNGPPVIPTVTIEDADANPSPVKPAPGAATANGGAAAAPLSASSIVSEKNSTPGDLPAGKAPIIPDWYKIGWRAVSGIDEPLPEGVEKDRGILFQHINEQYYGDWYHNAAIIIVAVVFTHLITLLRLGWGWILVLLAFCCTYYSTSIERFRRRARDDMQRELTKTRVFKEAETADWMNNFLARFWKIYEPVLSTTIVNSVAQILSASTPAFLDSIALTTFSLGNKAPHIDHVKTEPYTEEDIVEMQWGISFTPNDVADMTYREAEKKENPKIILEIRVGKGITATMPILLEDITFKGTMNIRMKLITAFPHIQIVDISFIEPPWIDYVLKPIGGETFGFDIASIPGLSSFIRDTTHSILGPMMYKPNVFTLNLEQLMSGVPLDTAIGVLQITIISASGIKASKLGGGTPDPYVTIAINNINVLDQTKPKMGTRTPVWNETKFVLVSSLSGNLNMAILDYNEHRKDTELGTVSWDLNQLAADSSIEGIVTPVLLDAKERGELKYDVSFFPVIKPAIVDGKPEPLPETSVGIVRLVVHQAKELDPSKNTVSKDLNPFVKIYTGDSASDFIHSTPVTKHQLNPIWESPKEFLCSDRDTCDIRLEVIDDRDFLSDPVIGIMKIRLNDLLEAKKQGKDWFPLADCKTGRIRISAEWKPLDMAGSLHGAAKYVPPIGVVRVLMKKAVDVKNVEAGLGGKSDPYVRVMVNDTIMARTEVVNNNLSPVWDQYMYIPVHSLKETVYFECMDYQHLTKDRPLGHLELNVSSLAAPVATVAADTKYLHESLGCKELVERLKVDHDTYKGELHFSAEFIPALHLANVSFEAHKNPIEKTIEDNYTYEAAKPASNGAAPASNGAAPASNGTAPAEKATAAPSENGDAVKKEANGNGTAHHDDGITLSKEQLLATTSGVIVFDVVSGSLAKKSRLEILMDDGYWPVFSTQKSRASHAQWDMVGEGFIKELDFGRVWLRLNANSEGEKEEILAEKKLEAKKFLEQALDGPTTFELADVDGDNKSTVVIAAKFVPVPIKLSPRESMNNQGHLRIDILDAKDLHAADRSGTSDPYVVISLDGEKIHKTDTKKKTLTPVWNETCECTIPSRVGAEMTLEVFDWDQIGSNESLGKTKIDVAALEPFTSSRITVPLTTSKHGQKGTVNLALLFTPQIVVRSRKSTSTFSTAGRAVTQVGAAPVMVGKGVIGGVGVAGKGVVGGVGAVGKGVKGVFGSRKKSVSEGPLVATGATDASGVPVPAVPAIVEPVPVAPGYSVANDSQTFPKTDEASNGTLEGIMRISGLSGREMADSDGDQVRPYVVATVGGKEVKTKHLSKTNAPEWDESFTFQVGPDTKTLRLEVMDHKTIGRDKTIGQLEIPIWDNIQASGGVSSTVVSSALQQGTGQISLRLEFEQSTGGALGGRGASIGSLDRPLVGNQSRLSMRKAKSPFAES